VASDFGPLIPQAGETGCHLPQPGGTEGALCPSYVRLRLLLGLSPALSCSPSTEYG
jgi:hypothetical protein